MPIADLPSFYPPDRAAWRAWLAEHHTSAPGIWVLFFRKATGQPTITYAEAVEGALCFGWIDSRPAKLDTERHLLLFTPRKARSPWSKLNKERVAHLLLQGLITPAGQARINAAQANGDWTRLDAAESLAMPTDLAAALRAAGANAEVFFARLSASTRKGTLAWLDAARRPETRAARVADTVSRAVQARKPKPFDR